MKRSKIPFHYEPRQCQEVPFKKRILIEEITYDLSNSMNWIVREIAPNALKTYDRFHVQSLVTDAVQTIRVKFRWKAIEEENLAILEAKRNKRQYKPKRYRNGETKKQLLARSRYLLYKTPNKWSESQRERAQILFEEFPELKKAYDYSIYFRNCYEHNNNQFCFEEWIEKVQNSNINELKVAAVSVQRHLGGILNYFQNHSTNAEIESFNSKLKFLKRQMRGINDKNFFFYRIIKYFA